MADYNLTGLSTRSFEHVVQALCVRVVGPGITVFGDGPDGGREATFRGEVQFPSDAARWNGYGIVQAKFRQRPSDNHSDNLKWLKKELSKELNKFKKKKALRPDYYILATNVVLTPGARGGKDQVDALFTANQERLGLKDWRVWDYDQTCRYLDNAPDIRAAYAAWITPGDVLTSVIDALVNPSRAKRLADALGAFVAKELYADQFANLEQAGHSVDDKIPLARVFVDLPVADSAAIPRIHERYAALEERYFLGHIIEVAKEKLDGQSVETRHSARRLQENGRYVLVGGPGQGKTTLGQFTCQVFRAAILQERPKSSIASEIRQALNGTLQQCESEGIELPTTKRFPIRVILSEFADALQRAASPLSLLAYMAKRISVRSDYNIDSEDLRDWIGKYPWLIVLDGLDEVPSSSNRDQVLSAIADFWSDVAASNGDVLVVATTRPQGYSDDFSPDLYRHLALRPLRREAALKYATRLVAERYGNEPARRLWPVRI